MAENKGLTLSELKQLKGVSSGKSVGGGVSPDVLRKAKSLGNTPSPSSVKQDSSIALGAGSAFSGNSMDHEIRPSSWTDGILGDLMRGGTRSALIGMGSATGAPFGPPGMALGGVGGELAYQLGQSVGQSLSPDKNNRVFGNAPETLVGVGNEAASNVTLELLGNKALGWITDKFKTPAKGWLDNIFNRHNRLDATDIAAIEANPDAKMTVGQATGSKLATWMEDVLAGSDKEKDFIDPAQDFFKKKAIDLGRNVSKNPTLDITKDAVGSTMGARSQARAIERRKSLSETIDNLYGNLRAGFQKNKDVSKVIETKTEASNIIDPTTGQPVVKTTSTVKDVEGPVFLEASQPLAQKLIAGIDEEIKANAEKGMPPELTAPLAKIKNLVYAVANAPKTAAGNKPVMAWDDMKDIRGLAFEMAEATKDLDPTARKRLGSLAEEFGNVLSVDKKASIGTWSKESQQLIKRADTLFQAKVKRYSPKLAQELAGVDPNTAQEKLLNDALTNVENARKYIKISGDRSELGTQFITNAIRDAQDGKVFLGTRIRNLLKDQPDIAGTVLNKNQRQSLEFLGRMMERVNPKIKGAGMQSLIYHGTVAGLTIVPAAVGIAQGEDKLGIAAKSASILAIPLAGRVFTKKVLMDPKKARHLALLIKTPPGTPKANWLSKSIFGTGKAAEGFIRDIISEVGTEWDETPTVEQ